jgi:hypothetical protein
MSKLKPYIGSIIKSALVMFAVGAMLAVAAPPLAVAMGLAETTAIAAGSMAFNSSPLWLGTFFAGFGALSAAVTPAINRCVDTLMNGFSRKPAAQPDVAGKAVEASPAIMTEVHHAASPTHFQDMATASKANAAQSIAGR